ncbi:NAD-dependent deacetylase sirtuin-2 [Trametes coccinea BRFM310]|uniref:NAD-dependent deacetylase sirtuin-2 n=1 Tax=Trametes coccinea (strain BRFM310) TaxID=1353009 RepID=A0A1Y2J342_TRAC3|nr:NAD-dependent deacetylase sirtuin-2 [Trametes coccinea BRFM310]
MGNEQSAPYDGPPEVLEAKDLPSIAKYMKSPACRRVCVMLGAGVSTAAGIPDFRSPGTGLYSNLQRLNLPYPEAVFEINYFRENPIPFYTLARELYPGQFRPTLTHTFVKLLSDHALLDTCFTQNIDTLERQAGVPGDKIVEAHGSFASQHCIECHASVDGATMRKAVETGDIVRCADCGGLVKPDIVFFGESLPPAFHKTVPRLRSADLLIVIGTSLTVHPFASLTTLVPEGCPRVLINMDPAGDIGARPDDVVLLGRCDEIIRDLCRELGWEEELDREWEKTKVLKPLNELAEAALKTREDHEPSTAGLAEAAVPQEAAAEAGEVVLTATEAELEDARVEAEVETITEQVEKGLEISEGVGPRPPITVTVVPESGPQAEEVKEAEKDNEASDASRNAGDASSESKEAGATAKEKL